MSRRKAPKVTLAGQRAIAESALRTLRSSGHRAPDGPTAERLIRAAGMARVEIFSEIVEVAKGNKFEPTPVDMVRVRIEDDPFSRLCAAGHLAPKDPELNALLARAGLEYRTAWSRSGMSAIRAADPEKSIVSGTAPGMFESEAQSNAFGVYCAASRAMHRDYRTVVDAIVLQEHEPLQVGRRVAAYRQEKMATAVAMHLLRRGLTELAIHLHLLAPSIDLSSAESAAV